MITLAVILSHSVQADAGRTNIVPWERQYKIKPHETDRMTPADVLGPDGIVYPNWTKCGVQGDIPDVKAVTSVEDFGAKADDNTDDSDALAKACQAAGEKGGGNLADCTRQFAGLLPHCNGMQIDDAINAVETVLQLDEPLNRAEIIAEMEVAGRLHAGEDQFFKLHLWSPRPSAADPA